jgi:hypothetical protein
MQSFVDVSAVRHEKFDETGLLFKIAAQDYRGASLDNSVAHFTSPDGPLTPAHRQEWLPAQSGEDSDYGRLPAKHHTR